MNRTEVVTRNFVGSHIDPAAEVDWSQFERELERAMRADEPNSCVHYHYPMGPNDLYCAQVDGEVVNMCRRCRQPF